MLKSTKARSKLAHRQNNTKSQTKPIQKKATNKHHLKRRVNTRSVRNLSTSAIPQETITVNHRAYNKPQKNRAYVGICLDGTNSDYINFAMNAGKMPSLKKLTSPKEFGSLLEMMQAKNNVGADGEEPTKRSFFEAEGVMGIAAAAFPTYTNPNNVSIITGVSPLHHGICGNYYFNEATQEAVMMTSPELIRSDSILSKVYQNDPENTRITIVTSKDKLKTLLLHQLDNDGDFTGSELPSLHHKSKQNTKTTTTAAIPNPNIRAFSVEVLNKHPELGQKYSQLVQSMEPPSIYDPMNSVYTLRLGLEMFKNDLQSNYSGSNIFYLSTTDYVQHKHAPGSPEANDFMYEIDRVIGEFHERGAVVGITADHGMNQKTHFNNKPDITFLGTEIDSIGVKGKVVLPITDPYVAHHGALGGFATIHLDKSHHKSDYDDALNKTYSHLRSLKGCYSVIGREDAQRGLDLPEDRIGDIVILGHKNSVFGTRPEEHDLLQLHGEVLRSHGSLEESLVPLIYNRPVTGPFLKKFGQGKIRNFDLFHGLFNGLGM